MSRGLSVQLNISFKFKEDSVLKQDLENAERYVGIFTIDNNDISDV